MEIFNYIYLLGIIYIVFSILWFFITSLPKFLSGAFQNNSTSNYLFKSIQYYCIAALTAVQTVDFIEKNPTIAHQTPFYIALGGIIIFLYLAGKTDKAIMSVQIQTNKSRIQLGGALKYEPHIVGISIILYLLSFNFPLIMHNNVVAILHAGILNFYDTFFIHFIISIVGFFFLFSMFSRGFTATGRLIEFIGHLITGKPLSQRKQKNRNPFQNFNNMGGFNKGQNPFNFNQNIFEQFNQQKQDEIDEDEYIDFEEVDEEEDN
ncbi:MAG: hypothetical protein N4A35_08300 [Flavobacteriales bacterium]|nr:hypothetical protein [Flavobacteriales bacterium]